MYAFRGILSFLIIFISGSAMALDSASIQATATVAEVAGTKTMASFQRLEANDLGEFEIFITGPIKRQYQVNISHSDGKTESNIIKPISGDECHRILINTGKRSSEESSLLLNNDTTVVSIIYTDI